MSEYDSGGVRFVDPRLVAALTDTIQLAAERAASHKSLMAFCRPGPGHKWQASEFQHLFLSGIYGNVTGRKQACTSEIIALVVTPEAQQQLAVHCANPYWFWATIGAAAKQATSLPLTLGDIECGAQALYEEHAEPMGKSCGVSGNPSGYSGPYTPWHLRDAFVPGYLWNNDFTRETGLQYGFFLLERAPLLVSEEASRSNAMNGMRLIFNPLFDRYASVQPTVAG